MVFSPKCRCFPTEDPFGELRHFRIRTVFRTWFQLAALKSLTDPSDSPAGIFPVSFPFFFIPGILPMFHLFFPSIFPSNFQSNVPSIVHHFPINFPSFSLPSFPSFSHQFPIIFFTINWAAFSHHFPINFPSFSHQFSIIFSSILPHFSVRFSICFSIWRTCHEITRARAWTWRALYNWPCPWRTPNMRETVGSFKALGLWLRNDDHDVHVLYVIYIYNITYIELYIYILWLYVYIYIYYSSMYIYICTYKDILYVISSILLVDTVCDFVASVRIRISVSLDPCDLGHSSHRWLLMPAFLPRSSWVMSPRIVWRRRTRFTTSPWSLAENFLSDQL